MYGRKAQTCRVYEYGCVPSPRGKPMATGEDEAVMAMRARNDLWNRLVEVEQRFQEQRAALLESLAPGYEAMDKPSRRAVFARDDVKAAIGTLDTARREAVRALCLASGLYWCNYEEVKNDYEAARKRRGGADLKFHAWHRVRGKLTVRWQHGLPVAAVFGNNTQLRIRPVDPLAWSSPSRSRRRRLTRTVVSIRIASEARRPVWLTLPMVMHRPLPEGGLIRSASVIRECVGLDWRWKLILVVALPAVPQPATAGSGTIAIDLGWRQEDEGLRVAAMYDSEQFAGTLILPDTWLVRMGKVDDLRSIRDKRFNPARADLVVWLAARPPVPATEEETWLRTATTTLSQWRSPARLAALVTRWRSQRFSGDEAIYEQLEAWRRREKHLYLWESNLRDKLIRERREIYRLFAAHLSRRYREVILEEFDLGGVARKKDNPLPEAARHQRVLAAPSLLRLAIENACRREGVVVTKVAAAYTTMTCPYCGLVEDFNRRDLEHTCGGCGRRRDQDIGAARLMLSQV